MSRVIVCKLGRFGELRKVFDWNTSSNPVGQSKNDNSSNPVDNLSNSNGQSNNDKSTTPIGQSNNDNFKWFTAIRNILTFFRNPFLLLGDFNIK